MKSYFEEKRGVMMVSSIAIVVLAVFLVVQIFVGLKTVHVIGSDRNNIITVTGTSEVNATPDVATFNFTVTKDGATTAEAQGKADPIINKSLAYLKEQGIDDKDIRTEDYNVAPQYDYRQGICTQYSCPPSTPVITGYQASQTITVKVRDIAKAGALLGGLGGLGVTSESSLTFTIDKEDALKNQARSEAIEKARAQAEELAKELHVRLGDITSFSEQGNGYYPMYAKASAGNMAMDSAVAPQAAQIPTGQNKITSNVTITYQIR